MLDLVKTESDRIDSCFLEPDCGSGNFLVQVLRRKLAAVELKYGKSDFERRHYALRGLMCIYGIELLADRVGHRPALAVVKVKATNRQSARFAPQRFVLCRTTSSLMLDALAVDDDE